MFRKDFVFWQEILFLSVVLTIVYLFGFFDNEAGVIFLVFISLFFLFYRMVRAVVYYRIILVGMALFVNGLLTFKYLQFSEMYLFNRSFQDKYETNEKDLTQWEYDETSAQEAIRCGAIDFLVKPVEMPAVLQAVARAALFKDHEGHMSAQGETRIQFTARLADGPREVAAAAEEQLVRKTLAETDHNVAQTARRLGLVRENVYYYLKKYGIRRPD